MHITVLKCIYWIDHQWETNTILRKKYNQMFSLNFAKNVKKLKIHHTLQMKNDVLPLDFYFYIKGQINCLNLK